MQSLQEILNARLALNHLPISGNSSGDTDDVEVKSDVAVGSNDPGVSLVVELPNTTSLMLDNDEVELMSTSTLVSDRIKISQLFAPLDTSYLEDIIESQKVKISELTNEIERYFNNI